MDCASVLDTAIRWNVSVRQVQRLLRAGRIPDAKKYGGVWLIPVEATKPPDPRTVNKKENEKPPYRYFTAMLLPKDNPDAVLAALSGVYHDLVAADLAYRRGNSEPAKAYWRSTDHGDETKLSAASLATAAAIGSGDYNLYYEVDSFLKDCIARAKTPEERALLSLPGTLAAVSMAAPHMTPDWLKHGDFSMFSAELTPFLLYLYMLHLRNTGSFSALLHTAHTAWVLRAQAHTFTWLDLYYLLLAAMASFGLGDEAQTKKYLSNALDLGMPCGFIVPFADNLGGFGGLMESLIEQRYPERLAAVTGLWGRSFKNWMRFHNEFTKENITIILTAQEYQVAHCIAYGATCAQTAMRMNLSVGRIKNILSDVYGKLYIQKRQQLRQYII